MPSKGSKKKVAAPAEVAPVAKKGDTGVSSMVIRSVAAIFLFLSLCSIIYLGHHALSVAVFLLEVRGHGSIFHPYILMPASLPSSLHHFLPPEFPPILIQEF